MPDFELLTRNMLRAVAPSTLHLDVEMSSHLIVRTLSTQSDVQDAQDPVPVNVVPDFSRIVLPVTALL